MSSNHHKLRSYMAKKQLMAIAKKAQSMFDRLPEDMPLDDWMESHIAQMDKMMDSDKEIMDQHKKLFEKLDQGNTGYSYN